MKLRNISDFTNNEYKQQAQHKNFSMIANLLSGVNFSSNKVLYTIYNENITSFLKTETVANLTATKTDYHGGSSNLNGVIFNNIKDYIGGNNLTLIDKKGDMGARLNPVCAAPRYNFVKKSKTFDYMFKKEDTYIIPRYEFEGGYIEYKYMLFILPMLLINGNEGMGSGHAQKIFPRNIIDISNYIINKLKDKQLNELPVYYKGFLGSIENKEESNKWKITGKVNRLSKTKTEIIEVPVNETYNSIIKKLDKLKDDNIIKSYIDLCDTKKDKFNFIIKHDDFTKFSDDEVLEKFKLVLNVAENYTVIMPDNSVKSFENIYDLIDKYIQIRLEYYSKRKAFLIDKMTDDITILLNKIRFIQGIIGETITFKNKSKRDIENDLSTYNYDLIDNSFDYLLNLNIYNLTKDKLEDYINKEKELQKKLEDYIKKDIKDIWIEEINELLKALGYSNKDLKESKKVVMVSTPLGNNKLYDDFNKTVHNDKAQLTELNPDRRKQALELMESLEAKKIDKKKLF